MFGRLDFIYWAIGECQHFILTEMKQIPNISRQIARLFRCFVAATETQSGYTHLQILYITALLSLCKQAGKTIFVGVFSSENLFF